MTDIIAVELSGGLGNQLFQFAAGFALSRRHNAQLILNTSLYDRGREPRRIALDPFALEGIVKSNAVRFSHDGSTAYVPIENALSRRNVVTLPIICESGFDYDTRFPTLQKNVLLRGYWQSYRYFEHLSDDLRRILRLDPNAMDSRNRDLLDEINERVSVAVHVRRGDYLLDPYRSVHGACSINYYRRAMDEIRSTAPGCAFYVFSDDAAWCETELAGPDVTVIRHNGPNDAHLDITLMTACRHRILSNSSLSWWAAYLGERPGETVIAPAPWLRNKSETSDLLRPHWTLKGRTAGQPAGAVDEQVARARVSVVIPAHDRPRMLEQAVQSAVQQTKPVFEIIIVLSDPSDACATLAHALARRHGLKVIAIPEANVSKARNSGIQAASGDWIAFLDDDDIWLPEKLERQLRTAVLLDVGVVSCDFILFDHDGDIAGSGLRKMPARLSLAEATLLGNYISGGSAAIIRTDILKRAGGYDEQLLTAEDHDLWRRLAWQNEIVVLSDRLVRIRRHEHQLSNAEALMNEGRRVLFTKMCRDTPAELRHMLFPTALLFWSRGWGVGAGDIVKVLPAFLLRWNAVPRVTWAVVKAEVRRLMRRFRATHVATQPR